MTDTPILAPKGVFGLAVAHPGHELRLTAWIAAVRPRTYVLTAGARNGGGGERAAASRRLARELGAAEGSIFGRVLDRDVYGWIMEGDARPFLSLAEELAASFVEHRLDYVVTDGWQLYNVAHDLWRLTVQAAAALATERLGRRMECLDYAVVPPVLGARALGPIRMEIRLSPQQLAAKRALAAGFPEIAEDVAEVERFGGDAFLGRETLHGLLPLATLLPAAGEKPRYEVYGEARVAAGRYAQVLRWRHAEPIVAALSARLDGRAAA